MGGLSHPHICPVFDVGSQDGIDYLVMEYLDGETLAQRLEKGALPLDLTLQIAIQIAETIDGIRRGRRLGVNVIRVGRRAIFRVRVPLVRPRAQPGVR